MDGLPGRAMKASVLHRGEAHQRLRLVQPEGAWNQAGPSPGGWCGQKWQDREGRPGSPGTHARLGAQTPAVWPQALLSLCVMGPDEQTLRGLGAERENHTSSGSST